MALGNQLERIGALVEQLGPLANKQRGMRIEADEWNALVAALLGVLEIDRAQEQVGALTLDQQFARIGHQHTGEVTADWLDAGLQAAFGSGGGSVTSRASQSEVEQKIQSLSAEVARLTALADAQGKLIDRAQVSELDRSRALRGFEARFAGVENLRTLATTLGGQVAGLTQNVDTVLELRSSLTDVTGAPIDIAALRQQVRDLEGLRENLVGVDGELLRLRDIEVQLKEVSDVLDIGGGRGLDGRFADFEATLDNRFSSRIDERAEGLRGELQGLSEQSAAGLRGELSSGLDGLRTSLTDATAAQIAGIEGRIGETLDNRLAQSTSDLRSDLLTAAGSLVDERATAVQERLNAALAAARAESEAQLRFELADGIGSLSGRINDLDTRVADRLTTTESQIGGVRDELSATLDSRIIAERDSFSGQLTSALDTRAELLQGDIGGLRSQLESLSADLIGGLDSRISAALEQQIGGLDSRIQAALDGALAQLPDTISRELTAQLGQIDLSGQFNRLRETITEQFRAELSQAAADQQTAAAKALEEAVAGLQRDIRVQQRELMAEVNKNIETFGDALRTDLTRMIDDRIGTTRPLTMQDFDARLTATFERNNRSIAEQFKQVGAEIAELRRIVRANG